MEVETSSILISMLLVSLIACVIKFLNWAWFEPKKFEKILREQAGLNGNPYRFLIGDFRDYVNASKQEQTRSIQLSDKDLPSHICPYNHKILSQYGKNSFFWFGPKPMVNIAEPKLLKEIFTKRDLFQRTRPDPIGETIVGGLAYLEGEKWAKHRKIINPTFHMEKLKNMLPAISLSCSDMTDKWDALISCNDEDGKSKEFDIWPYLESLSGDVISRTLFGSNYEEGRWVFNLQNEQVKLFLEILPFTLIPGWRHVPSKTNRRLKALQNEIQSILRTIIERRKKAKENGEVQGALLSTIMESNREGGFNEGMSIEEVVEECKLFYFAGSETTSILICWTMVMLSEHQDWQNRARDEVVQVFGNDQPTFDGISRLKVVNMILLEVLRMYPPVPLLGRSPTETLKLENLTLPKGAGLMLLIGTLHYDPEIWGKDANDFNPERFSKGVSGAVEDPFSYMPFGAGQRICLGQNLAMIEAKVALAMILQRFSFELGSSYVHAPFPIITLRPQRGAKLLLHKL